MFYNSAGYKCKKGALKSDLGTQPMDLGICQVRPKPSAN